jgi:hypothetical protein
VTNVVSHQPGSRWAHLPVASAVRPLHVEVTNATDHRLINDNIPGAA